MSVLAHRLDGPEGAPVVLLLNGGMMSMGAWEEIATALGTRYRVLRCDLRGQLLSPGAPPEDIRGHVPELVLLLDHLGIPRVHVLGTSFGGEVGVLFAAAHPERTATLIAVTAVDFFDAAMLEDVDRLRALVAAFLAGEGTATAVYDYVAEGAFSPEYRSLKAADLAARRALVSALPKAWYEGLAVLLASLHTSDLRGELGAVTAPALVVSAERDAAMPLERSEGLAQGLKARHEVVAGSGHALIVEATGPLLSHVLAFLDDSRNLAPPVPGSAPGTA